jgi:hypothetical protein
MLVTQGECVMQFQPCEKEGHEFLNPPFLYALIP